MSKNAVVYAVARQAEAEEGLGQGQLGGPLLLLFETGSSRTGRGDSSNSSGDQIFPKQVP